MKRPDVRYRFHGRTPPTPGQRQPLALAPTPQDVEEGVVRIRLYDPIDSWGDFWGVSASEFAEVLDGLDPSVQEIRLHLNSPGGEVFEGLAILNLLRQHRARVVTVVDGIAASIASVIAMAGDEVVMSPNSELMIHDAWGICIGNAADMRDLARTLDHLSDNVASVYASKAGGSTEGWRALMIAETWYGADEALAAGLADRVAESSGTAQNRFDLADFKYSGRRAAPPPPAASAEGLPPGPAPAAHPLLALRERQHASAEKRRQRRSA